MSVFRKLIPRWHRREAQAATLVPTARALPPPHESTALPEWTAAFVRAAREWRHGEDPSALMLCRLEPWHVEVHGISRDQSQVVMQRCRGEQAIDCRKGTLGGRLQSPPGVCHGRIDRQEALPEQSR
jgi:hypothetical protein